MPPSADRRGEPELGRDEAVTLIVRSLAALIAFVFAADVASVVHIHRVEGPASVDPAVVAKGARGSSTTSPLASGVGPPPGVEVIPYVVQRRTELNKASGRRVAVVSFTTYLNQTTARVTLGPVAVDSFLVAAPGGEPSDQTDLTGWAAAQRADATEQIGALQKILPTESDPAFRADYQSRIGELTRLLAALDPKGAVIFGAVVRGTVDQLRTVALSPAVRLVDLGADDRPLPGDQVRGIRPEETVRAGNPPTRPV